MVDKKKKKKIDKIESNKIVERQMIFNFDGSETEILSERLNTTVFCKSVFKHFPRNVLFY